MKVFITGGNSFLGHHLLSLFDKAGIEYYAPSSSIINLLDYEDTRSYLENKFSGFGGYNAVLHLAAKCGGIQANSNNPADFLRENTQMGLNVYELARHFEIPYVYSLGTVCMYPKYGKIPLREDEIWEGFPEETNAPYSQAKRTLLMLHQTYREQYGMKGAFLVPVNLMGEFDSFHPNKSHVIPALIKKFVDAEEQGSFQVNCFGSGYATREFLYAGDAAEAIFQVVSSLFDYEQPINLGTGKDILIKDLAYLIKELVDFDGEIVFDGSVSDGQPKRRLDVSRAKEVMNWEAKTSLREGLIKTIDWYRKNKCQN